MVGDEGEVPTVALTSAQSTKNWERVSCDSGSARLALTPRRGDSGAQRNPDITLKFDQVETTALGDDKARMIFYKEGAKL
jgi:hypothetical protein